ncbi:stage II sporulation protein R [Sporolactobacillus terrae]|uniref:Stage II sporulation protein R n=1 Tax=Sporolactobacillus terrae TaxID=269673 RepID=A0A410DCA3_9BACL|nr:stage II sporulation protein R [Sporolactobacillus terrae]QAA23664.1 stage II sporulation protein R [Sporolactobacillus terrae]QAA26634.1 stage II sporulation protein R [Sporolactobacillus terrae]UAK15704.1 stage II sporulation protein R [Sporolactobacillus terrae]BBO00189.1 stage II sporulation protein R [Sporolactobacillus terrae]
MRKPWILMLLLTINLVFVFFFWQYSTAKADEKGPIPSGAIRLRILANSDSPADQAVKRQIRNAVNAQITTWVQDLKSTNEAKRVIRAHMPQLNRTVKQALKKAHADSTYKIKLGQAEFPTKMYGTFVYPAGKYDALVITLGDGRGANWWCVLFPPLCFLDFSNSDAAAKNNASTERTASDQDGAKQTVKTTRPTSEDAAQQTEKPEKKAVESDDQEVQVHSFVVDFFTGVWRSIAG